ncbi:hypothetical protein FS764_11395 [Agrobacterium vitis]|uniref:hypothetical protein n=1 Tax=Agrobacterium vitis TaxID=373 RepID=UPI001F1754B1|nr:hypothetical protein [Agrobacterium vitis]MCF1467514.1 hypothetical protein [Agrobacterium vitis]
MIRHGDRTPDHSGKRFRASNAAVSAALRAMAANGIAGGKICISGGQVEIYCATPRQDAPIERDNGLEPWDNFDRQVRMFGGSIPA